jgi:hypothetical protein
MLTRVTKPDTILAWYRRVVAVTRQSDSAPVRPFQLPRLASINERCHRLRDYKRSKTETSDANYSSASNAVAFQSPS